MKSKGGRMEQQQVEADLWQEFNEELSKAEKINVEYPKGVTPIQADSLNKFWLEIFLKEKLPEGQINEKLEKNFAIYIVQNKLDISKIKEKYVAQGWSPNALLGWIKKVIAGDIKQFNVGEIINWCKEFKPEIIEMFGDLKNFDETKILRRSDLKFKISHLPLYSYIDSSTQIIGGEYNHLKKLLHYHLISGVIPEHLLLVRNGQIEIDLRDYLFLVYPTGASKGNVKNLLLKVKRDLGQEAITLTSYQEEQFVGKIICRRKKIQIGETKTGTPKYKTEEEWIKNYGHFKAKEIVIDESKSLLQDREKEASRNFLLIAMDKYGQNEIYKRLTENLANEQEVLRYFPNFNALFGTQPFKFHEDNIALNGFLKRVSIDYLPVVERKDSDFDFRMDNKKAYSPDYDKLLNGLKEIIGLGETDNISKYATWSFSQDFDLKFKECFRLLRYAGLLNSNKKRNYTRLVEWQLQDRLLRKACILAISLTKKPYVTAEHCELAFLDLLEDFIIELEYVNDKIYGELDYGSVWGTSDLKQKKLLEALFKARATSEEASTISIKDFQENMIQPLYKCGFENARKIYYKMLEQGLICSSRAKIGNLQIDSKVWLAHLPEEDTTGKTGNSGINPKLEYCNILAKYYPEEQGGGNSGKPQGD